MSLKPGIAAGEESQGRISDAIVAEIESIARPKAVLIVPDMPKTRSGKIMRLVLGSVSGCFDAGDVSTLVNPEVVEVIRRIHGPCDVKQAA